VILVTVDVRTTKNISTAVWYRSADKSLARPTSRCISFDGENISFDGSLVIQGVPGGMDKTSGECSLC